MWRLRTYLKRERVDIVQTHLYGPGISAIAAARLANVPVKISTVHDMDPWRMRRRLKTDKVLMGWRDAVFCVSEPVRQVYIERTGCPPDKVWVMPNGLDLSGFRVTRSREEVRSELGIPHEDRLVGMVANLVPIKNHWGFLEVAAVIRRRRNDVSFLLVGEGDLQAGLKNRAAALGLRDSVVFAGARRDVADLLGAMDCFLLTSFREAFSIAALESMALGVPVVATNRGGVSDIIRSREEGLLADPNDPEAMAVAVLRVLEDAELRETLIRNGRKRAQDFDMVRVARHTASVYRQLLASKSDA
jgi:glycosyltransferase involved in cell wall biosynthesis